MGCKWAFKFLSLNMNNLCSKYSHYGSDIYYGYLKLFILKNYT